MIVALGHSSKDGRSPGSVDYVADLSFEVVSVE
jgi:hypothetical protein